MDERKASILVMDDEGMLREVLTGMLQVLGFSAVAVKDGEEALAAYAGASECGEPYAAVILDWSIPQGMGGRETLERLRKIDPEVRTVITSGYSTEVQNEFDVDARPDAVIGKPFKLAELSAALDEILKSRGR